MKSINVKAERSYDVLIDCDWRSQVIERAANRARVAVIHSQSMTKAVQLEANIDAEIFYFPCQMVRQQRVSKRSPPCGTG